MKFKKCCINKPSAFPGNKVGFEVLDSLIQDGYDRIELRDEVGACDVWLKAWNILKTQIPPGIKSIEEAGALFDDDGDLFNWVQDLETELGNAAIDIPLFHDKRIAYCREFNQLFPRSSELIKHMKLAIADSLFQMGKKDEAEQEYKRMVVEYPKYPWTYIHWGDFYAGEDDAKAEVFYRKALGLDKTEDKVIQERIRDLKNGK